MFIKSNEYGMPGYFPGEISSVISCKRETSLNWKKWEKVNKRHSVIIRGKERDRIGLRLIMEDLKMKISFPADIQAIPKSQNWFRTNKRPTTINILMNSKFAMRAITTNTVKSRTVLSLTTILNRDQYASHGYQVIKGKMEITS